MIEFLPIVIGAAALLPSIRRTTERDQIEETFVRLNFGVKENGRMDYPWFVRKEENEIARRYLFKLPTALHMDDTMQQRLNDSLSTTLNKKVDCEWNGLLIVWVYKRDIPSKWEYRELTSRDDWSVPVGMGYRGIVWHDFDAIPHMTVSGATRWGKTVFLKVSMTYLIENHGENAEFYILDLKGGLAFHRYAKLKQVKAVAGNFEESAKVMRMIKRNILQQESNFKARYLENITDTDLVNRKYIIIDEAGELLPHKGMTKEERQQAEFCQQTMSHIARVSGGLGFRMIFCTQYPTADVLPRQVKANASAKVAFRLENSTHSKVAIDETGAEKLPVKGRAIYRTVDRHVVQVPFISNEEMWSRVRRYEGEFNEGRTENEAVGEDLIEFG